MDRISEKAAPQKAESKTETGRKPKVVFTFVEAGMGHIIPMTGMYESFRKKYGDRCEVVKSNIFSDSAYESVRKMGEKLSGHTKKTASNRLYNRFEAFSYLLPSKITLAGLDAYFRKPIKDFLKEYSANPPDILVASYYLPAHLAIKANEKGLANAKIVTYTPDPYIYPAWDRKSDIYIVNNETAEKQALKKGFKKDRVKRVPFIFKAEVTGCTVEKDAARKELGLSGGFTVLFTSGAYGAKNTYRLMRKIRNVTRPITLVVICGKNREMQETVASIFAEKPSNVTLKIIGFTERMADYMRAADLIIGKAGMNTIMESVYLGCPMIINAEANALEEHITKFSEKEKICLREKNPDRIVGIIDKCAGGEDLFSECRKNFAKFHDPTGADESADSIYGLLKEKFPNV